MVTGNRAEKAHTVLDTAALFVTSTKIEPADTGKGNGRRAHGARLQRDIQIAAGQALGFQPRRRRTDGQHLGMGRRIGQLQRSVAGPGQHLAASPGHHRPYRHLAARRCRPCLGQGQIHECDARAGGHEGSLFAITAFFHLQFWYKMAMTEKTAKGERIAKWLARAGVASRREAERMIMAGRVRLDGKVIRSPALNITGNEEIRVDTRLVTPPEPTRLWRYHKPAGLLTTARDPEGRPTVFEKLPADLPRVISVGRLDINTEGLLLLTNDGALARKLELPATGWLRRYRVRAFGRIEQGALDTLKNGMTLDGVHYGPVEALFEKQQGSNCWLTLALREGKNREIRKLLEHFGLRVNRLIRLSYGPFALRELTAGEVKEVPRRILRDQLGPGWAEKLSPDTKAAGGQRRPPRAGKTGKRLLKKPEHPPRGQNANRRRTP